MASRDSDTGNGGGAKKKRLMTSASLANTQLTHSASSADAVSPSANVNARPVDVPWAPVVPITVTNWVLRHRWKRDIDLAGIAWHIAEFALDRPTWEAVRTCPTTDAKALCAAQWLMAHGIRPINTDYSNPNPIMDAVAQRGFLSVLRFLHEECGLLLTTGCLENATTDGHFDVVKYVCERGASQDRGLANSYDNPSRFDFNFTSVDVAATESLCHAVGFGHLEIFRYLIDVAGAKVNRTTAWAAANAGNLEIMEFIWSSNDQTRDVLSAQGLKVDGLPPTQAFRHLPMVNWINDHGLLNDITDAIDIAASQGNVEVVKFLHELARPSDVVTTDAMDLAAIGGHVAVVQYLHEHRSEGCTTDAMDYAAADGYLEVIKFLHDHRREGCTHAAMNQAAGSGHLDIVKFLHEHRTEGHVEEAIDIAVERGHVEIVQYLHQYQKDGYDLGTLSSALRVGDVGIVSFLLDNRPDLFKEDGVLNGWTYCGNLDGLKYLRSKDLYKLRPTDLFSSLDDNDLFEYVYNECVADATTEERHDAISQALSTLAGAGKLSQIKFLDSHRRPGEVFESESMDEAAAAGHYDVVLYLHRRPHFTGWTTNTMDMAARHGDLEIVQFLHENRSEGCTTDAMDGAAENGHWDVVKYLFHHRSEGCTSAAIKDAAKCNSVEMVKFFYEDVGIGCLNDAHDATIDVTYCREDLREYLRANVGDCHCAQCER